MSGHSKWSKVKHQKAVEDPKRGRAFSKLTALITVVARDGGDIESNPKLKVAVEKAKEFGMPKENIERAIRRGAGEINEEKKLEEIFCEAYGPGGSAILIQAITDNKNRTLAELRHLLQQYDAKMADTGSVRWMFEELGKITFPKKFWSDDISLEAIENGAEEIKEKNKEIVIYTHPQNLAKMKDFFKKKTGQDVTKAEFDFISKQFITITDKETKDKLENLFNALDEHDDVGEIYSNIKEI